MRFVSLMHDETTRIGMVEQGDIVLSPADLGGLVAVIAACDALKKVENSRLECLRIELSDIPAMGRAS